MCFLPRLANCATSYSQFEVSCLLSSFLSIVLAQLVCISLSTLLFHTLAQALARFPTWPIPRYLTYVHYSATL